MTTSDLLPVLMICAWPEQVFKLSMRVAAGTTAGELLERSGVKERFPDLAAVTPGLAVYGRIVGMDYVLAAGDRLEVLRPLLNDPKEARRKRAAEAPGTRRLRPPN